MAQTASVASIASFDPSKHQQSRGVAEMFLLVDLRRALRALEGGGGREEGCRYDISNKTNSHCGAWESTLQLLKCNYFLINSILFQKILFHPNQSFGYPKSKSYIFKIYIRSTM